MANSRCHLRRFWSLSATVAVLFLLGSCTSKRAASDLAGVEPESTQKLAVVSPELLKSVPSLSSPEYIWLRQAIQNTGDPVKAADYPWQVGLSIRFGAQSWRCGGTLVSRSYILTAAHCLDGAAASNMGSTIRIGLNSIDVYHGSDKFGEGTKLALDANWPVTFHTDWKKTGQAYAWDAALLKLANPITVITAPVRSSKFIEGVAITSGWGDYDASNQPSILLRAVAVPVVTNDICRSNLPQDKRSAVNEYTLCAVSQVDDACARDSGGPLVIGGATRPQLIGIVSWGLVGSCGVAGTTGVLVGAYTRVSEIAAWVQKTSGDATTVTSQKPDPIFQVRPRTDM